VGNARRTGTRWWYLLLLIPIVAVLWTPIYAKADPELFGFPFFYWYQFVWVPLSAVITYFVYTRTRTVGRPPDEGDGFEVPFEPGPVSGTRAGTTTTRQEPQR
jgi:membrane protein implicated in regulation of membrane protease activity